MVDRPGEIQPARIGCVGCGYDLSGTAVGGLCPECGTPVKHSLTSDTTTLSNSTAVIAMVLGILSLAACALLGPFAIWYYYKARNEIAAGQAAASGITMATVGLILGWVSIGLVLLQIVVVGIMIFGQL